MKTFKDLTVWKEALDFTVELYEITKAFPKEEIYGITPQVRRASVSIVSNIAEGSKRGTKKDFAQFIRVAQGSGAELETQLLICHEIGYIKTEKFNELDEKLLKIMKMLTGLYNSTQDRESSVY